MTKSEYDRRMAALHQRYPGLFKRFPAGAEPRIAPGWLSLFEQLCADVDALKLSGPYFEQIGEKYGELRLDVREEGLTRDQAARLNELVEGIESQSASTCMWCGAPGRSRGGKSWDDWVFTACDEHAVCPPTFYDDPNEMVPSRPRSWS